MPTVTLSNGKIFVSEPGRTLLESANSQGVVLEYSCRTGRCGVCKAAVVRGRTEVLHEEQALSEEEGASGRILTCCRSALDDVELDIEDFGTLAGIQVKTLPCRIDSIDRLTESVLRVVLKIPPTSTLDFLAGQYVDVIGREGVRRSYSIANAPRQDSKLELQIRQVADGVMSEYWFDEAQKNDLLRLEGPLGTFSLRNTQVENIVFLATGTGIAPVKAMLEQLASDGDIAAGKKIHVYWGGRTVDDIYWRPDLRGLDIKFTPVISRVDKSWSGRNGYVQQSVIDDLIDLRNAVVYACGSDAMIHSARKMLLAAGLPGKNFYSDAFVSSN